MTSQCGPFGAAAIGGLWSIAFSAAAWADHPIPRPSAGAEWSWMLLWFLGACVFIVAFVATWAVFSFFERRQRAESDEGESARRS
jgi:heme/copper-type cytochrome/quinol oxidase subunit 2